MTSITFILSYYSFSINKSVNQIADQYDIDCKKCLCQRKALLFIVREFWYLQI